MHEWHKEVSPHAHSIMHCAYSTYTASVQSKKRIKYHWPMLYLNNPPLVSLFLPKLLLFNSLASTNPIRAFTSLKSTNNKEKSFRRRIRPYALCRQCYQHKETLLNSISEAFKCTFTKYCLLFWLISYFRRWLHYKYLFPFDYILIIR